MRTPRIHWRTFDGSYLQPLALCDGSPCRQTASNTEAVTCLRCMYHLGLYVPLVKLREHQEAGFRQEWDAAVNKLERVGNGLHSRIAAAIGLPEGYVFGEAPADKRHWFDSNTDGYTTGDE